MVMLIYIWYTCTIISMVLNTSITVSEHCNLPSVASIFYWFYFFSKAPLTIQKSYVVGLKFLRHREMLNRISSLGMLLLNDDVKTFRYWLLSVGDIIFILYWSRYPWHFSLVRNSADILVIFLFPCNASFQLWLFFVF